MLSTAVISLMYCSIQTRKRGLTADRENNMWRYLDGVSAANIHPRIDEAVPVVTDEITAELAGGEFFTSPTINEPVLSLSINKFSSHASVVNIEAKAPKPGLDISARLGECQKCRASANHRFFITKKLIKLQNK